MFDIQHPRVLPNLWMIYSTEKGHHRRCVRVSLVRSLLVSPAIPPTLGEIGDVRFRHSQGELEDPSAIYPLPKKDHPIPN